MDSRIAIIGIIIEDLENSHILNEILHEYNNIIIGRMGIPYKTKNIGIISLIVESISDEINEFSGKIGQIKGINVKTMYSKLK